MRWPKLSSCRVPVDVCSCSGTVAVPPSVVTVLSGATCPHDDSNIESLCAFAGTYTRFYNSTTDAHSNDPINQRSTANAQRPKYYKNSSLSTRTRNTQQSRSPYRNRKWQGALIHLRGASPRLPPVPKVQTTTVSGSAATRKSASRASYLPPLQGARRAQTRSAYHLVAALRAVGRARRRADQLERHILLAVAHGRAYHGGLRTRGTHTSGA